MTDVELPANVKPFRPKDRTAAERKRRSRAKQRKRRVTPVTILPVTPPVTPPVTVGALPGHGRDAQRIDEAPQLGRSATIRNAARDAALVTAPENRYLARLVTFEPAETPLDGRARPTLRHVWTALGRALVGLAIVGTGACIAFTSMRGSAWFGHSLTPDPTAGEIYSNLSVAAEVLACLIPTGIRFYAASGERWTVFYGWMLMAVALVVVFFAAGGFAITNIHSGIEARIERETPAMRDLRAQIAGLDRSIASECVKRGDRCRELERQRADANAKLATERAGTKADADPQAVALGISSLTLHLVQAGAMVALCLFSGLFISFGAGLIWSARRKAQDE